MLALEPARTVTRSGSVTGAQATEGPLTLPPGPDATTGLEFGLFNWVVDADSFNDKIDKVVVSIMRGPALALAEIKRLYRASHDNSWNEQSHQEAESIAALAATADHLEGVAAFVEKRRPGFVGR